MTKRRTSKKSRRRHGLRARMRHARKRFGKLLGRRFGRFWKTIARPFALTPARRRKLFTAAALAVIWGGVGLFFLLSWYAYDLPDVRQVEGPTRRPSIVLMTQDGTQFARFGDLYGEQVPLAQLPKYLTHAVMAVEDRRFFDHGGVDVFGLARAMFANLRAGRVVQGGSTITQQLAKNLFLTPERTFRRKVQEMMLAIWLEHTYSKDQILGAYLNRVYLGSGTYGVDAAARVYFGKSARNINLGEAALLAGLLKAPSRYAPTNNPDQAKARAALVLNLMVETGFIDERQRRFAMAEMGEIKPAVMADARYFAAWVADQATQIAGSTGQDILVTTTLDMGLQRAAEKYLEATLEKDGTAGNIGQAALLSLAPDGAVRAYVGGRDFRESEYDRVTQSRRQTGSAFKPFIYLAAIQAGLQPDTVLEDAPIKIGSYSPTNYDNQYRGEVTARQALAESLNTVAVRVLHDIGIAPVVRAAGALGITSPLNRDLSLALGTSEASLMELTTAFAAIAAGGRAVTPYAVISIRVRDGQEIYRRPESAVPPVAVDPEAIAVLTDMMMSVVQEGTGRRARLDRQAAGKTGTTQDYRDAWFVGFTSDYTTGVWMGNDDNASMKRVTGGGAPAQLWHDYMAAAEAGRPAQALPSLYAQYNYNRAQAGTTAAQGSEQSQSLTGFIMRLLGVE
ncbi:MAG: PBP1A family penicillin-binding protein [Alphaproteobacteria bacterium]|nr:PBP1A family penicillin-binding protein [Alphaproteobacteria bacterium]